jgi:hypothetical protein
MTSGRGLAEVLPTGPERNEQVPGPVPVPFEPEHENSGRGNQPDHRPREGG